MVYELLVTLYLSHSGDYTECGQVIPVVLNGVHGSFVHSMYLDDHGPIAGGREIWGYPKKVRYLQKFCLVF